MHVTTSGIVLRSVDYKEADKILTILTPDHGKITATARGSRRKKSPLAAGCGNFILSTFVLYQYQGRWTVKEVDIDREFRHIHEDLPRFSLACYFGEVCELLALEQVAQDSIFSLFLNCLYVLDTRKETPLPLIKAVFEFRVACDSGYEPMLDHCHYCESEEPPATQFSFLDGTIHCGRCGRKEFHLSPASLSALRFIRAAHPKQIFQFTHSNPSILTQCTELYLQTQLEHAFRSLSFYNNLISY